MHFFFDDALVHMLRVCRQRFWIKLGNCFLAFDFVFLRLLVSLPKLIALLEWFAALRFQWQFNKLVLQQERGFSKEVVVQSGLQRSLNFGTVLFLLLVLFVTVARSRSGEEACFLRQRWQQLLRRFWVDYANYRLKRLIGPQFMFRCVLDTCIQGLDGLLPLQIQLFDSGQ